MKDTKKLCKKCGAEIQKNEKVCPNCGAKQTSKAMKPLLIIAGVLWAFVFLLIIVIAVLPDPETNPLFDCKIHESNVYNGTKTTVLGKSAYIKIDSSDFENVTDEELAEYLESDTLSLDQYNWFYIYFPDTNKGIFINSFKDGLIMGDLGTVDSLDESIHQDKVDKYLTIYETEESEQSDSTEKEYVVEWELPTEED